MDRQLIAEKLESLRRCIKRIEDKCPDTVEALISNWDLQDIVTLNLTRAMQLCVDISALIIAQTEETPPETMGAVFDTLARLSLLDTELAIRMKKSVGFRNIAVHNYKVIDWMIVHAICRKHLRDFKAFAEAVHVASERF